MDLWSIAVLDQHAHPILTAEATATLPYGAAFTEAYAPTVVNHHVHHTLCYRRSLRDIGALLECEPTEAAILAQRQAWGLEKLTQRCLEAAHLEAVILDDGFRPDGALPPQWHHQFVPTGRLIRLEYLAEQLLPKVDRFDVFVEWFRSEIDPLPDGVVGLKSIAAYRVGLDVQFIDWGLAEAAFYALKQQQVMRNAPAEVPLRLADKALIDFLLLEALDVAARYQIPVQFHTGFGDPDLDLRLANPLHLRPVLEEPRFQAAPIVLLHAAYPFTREAGFLASVYPQVYVDFGLAVPSLSIQGMRRVVHQLLELAPTSKILYSSDAHFIPELFYLGAYWGREVLTQVLEETVQAGDLTSHEADDVAIAILNQNGRSLYGFPSEAVGF